MGNTLERCEGGAFTFVESCGLGCLPTGCRAFDPSNVDASLFLPPDGSSQALASPTWDTTSCAALPHAPLDEATYCVLRFPGDLTVTGTLTIRGDRPLIALVSGRFTLSGAIDANADGLVGGPGAGRGATSMLAATGSAPGGNGSTSGLFEDGGGGGGGSACAD
ncbi:MAG: hypothetical protein KF901_10405, partial [Myxococcales bacterium]|nr:hypothetical protein [Myxococcales bacterium]